MGWRRLHRLKVRLGITWSHSKKTRWIRVWCLFGHEWYAINGGPLGYLLPDEDGRFQQCGRCGKRRFSKQRAADAIQMLHERVQALEALHPDEKEGT